MLSKDSATRFAILIAMKAFLRTPIGRIIVSFVKAFIAAFIIFVPGILAAPDWNAQKSAIVAAIIAALDAAFKAIQIALENS